MVCEHVNQAHMTNWVMVDHEFSFSFSKSHGASAQSNLPTGSSKHKNSFTHTHRHMLTATSTSCFKSVMFSNNRSSPHNEFKHKLAQTPTDTHHYPNTQTLCSLTRNSFTGGMGTSSPDLLWSQIFTVSVTLSETCSTPKNSKSQLDILWALLLYTNHNECWSSERFHVMSNNLTTSCCSAEGKEDGRLWVWKKRREGGGEGRKL